MIHVMALVMHFITEFSDPLEYFITYYRIYKKNKKILLANALR